MWKRTLWAGFGGVLVLIALCGIATLTGFATLQSQSHSHRATALQRADDLRQVREAVLLSGTLARDYLFWADTDTAAGVRDRFHRLERESTEALARLTGPGAATLRGEVAAYWKSLEVMMEVAGRERRHAVDRYFYRDLTKRLDATLSIADRAAQLAQLERDREQSQIATFAQSFVRIMAAAFLITLSLGAVIAYCAARVLVRLEREARTRRTELEALSSRLVKSQEEERKAVARELHDQVGQMLTALSMECGRALHTHPQARPNLEPIARLTESLIVAVRDISLSLRPSMLDDFGLVPALEWHAREVHRRSGIQVTIEASGNDCEQLADTVRTCIYRVAQEALRNCERHANATRADLLLKRTGPALRMSIADNGQGFDNHTVRGLGLIGMRERVEAIGGRLAIESHPGAGTRVIATVPIAS
ncbi:MAG: sensor histidine kinase [Acidobacteria bacterium]|nr:sensor histidine kinase [Acidobacteriota bacterium]